MASVPFIPQMFLYPHTDLNQQDQQWLISQILSLQEASGEGVTKVLYFDSTTDPMQRAVAARDTLIVINDGQLHTMAGETIDASNVLLFLSGLLGGVGTVNAKILAGKRRIFAAGSTITVGAAQNTVGYPEYYGAEPGSLLVDSAPAIEACVNTFPITDLAAGDYYLASSLYLRTSNRILRGSGTPSGSQLANAGGTRLVMTDPGMTGVIIGDPSLAFDVTTIDVSGFTVTALPIDYSDPAVGIRVRCMRNLQLHDVNVVGVQTAFEISSIMDVWVTHCRAIIGKADADTTVTCGFKILQTTPYGSANSSISSLWLRECEINYTNTSTVQTTGYGIWSPQGATGLADLYIDACNFVGVPMAVSLHGLPANTIQQNVWLRDNTIDNCLSAVEIDGGINAGIVNNWISCGAYASASTHRGAYIHDNANAGVTLDGNLIKNSDTSTATAYGIRIAAAHCVKGSNTVINFPNPCFIGVGASTSPLLHGHDLTINAINTKADYTGASQGILRAADCWECRLAAGGHGTHVYRVAVELLGTTYNCVGDVSTANASIANAKLINGGTVISTPFTALGNNNVMIGT